MCPLWGKTHPSMFAVRAPIHPLTAVEADGRPLHCPLCGLIVCGVRCTGGRCPRGRGRRSRLYEHTESTVSTERAGGDRCTTVAAVVTRQFRHVRREHAVCSADKLRTRHPPYTHGAHSIHCRRTEHTAFTVDIHSIHCEKIEHTLSTADTESPRYRLTHGARCGTTVRCSRMQHRQPQ